MQITIGQEEFNEAMQCWLTSQGFSIENFDVTVNVIAGRKFGTSAEISLAPKGSTKIPSGGIEAESKNEDDVPNEAKPSALKLGGE